MSNLPDIGTFIKHDPQRFVVGSLANQIRVLIHRMKMRGYKPWKILLSPGLRFALRSEMEGKIDYQRHDKGDMFMGLPIKLSSDVVEPIIMIEPEACGKPTEAAQSTPEEVVWRRRKQLAS